MKLFLLRFWPVLIPLATYWLWWRFVGRRATIEGRPARRFRDGPWYWAVLASLLVAAGCFVAWAGQVEKGTTGAYTPPHLEGGKVVPGRVAAP